MDKAQVERLAERLGGLSLKQRQKLLTDIRSVIPPPRLSKYCPAKISPKQEGFLSAPNLEILFGGAAGGSKTSSLLIAGLQYADLPNYDALIIRRSFAELRMPGSTISLAEKWLAGTDARWREGRYWQFPKGATLNFGYLANDNDKWQYGSSNFNYIAFDEAAEFPDEKIYTFLFSRLRRIAGSEIPPRMRLGANPIGPGAPWLKKRFITSPDPIDDGEPCLICDHAHWRDKCEIEKCGCAFNPNSEPRLYVPAKLADNPFIDHKAYRQSLAKLDSYTRRALENGDWDAKPPGKMFRREWFRIVKSAPRTADVTVRFWDLAATPEDKNNNPSWTCGVRMSYSDGLFCIEDVARVRESAGDVKALVKQTAALDGHDVEIYIEQEPGSSGKAVIADYARTLPGYVIKPYPASGSKEARAMPYASQVEGMEAGKGNVFIVEAAWNEAFLEEHEQFPSSRVKNDQVDAAAGGYNVISEKVEAGDISELWSGGQRETYLE